MMAGKTCTAPAALQAPHLCFLWRARAPPSTPACHTSQLISLRHLRYQPLTLLPRATESSDSMSATADEWCVAPYVAIDNKKNPRFTVLEIEVLDYPGLMRVIAWCLNGLDLVAQNAVLSTSDDGVVHNTFWLSTRKGKKLSDGAMELLVDRVRECLATCSPKPGEEMQTEFSSGPIDISNTQHSEYTTVTIKERQRTPGFLLEVASVLSGLNVQIFQGVIQGCTDCGDEVPSISDAQPLDDQGARVFKFWVLNRDGKKLPHNHAKALLYALGTGLGFSSQRFPLMPPNREYHRG